MVVAEIPLWLVHASGGTGGANGMLNPSSGSSDAFPEAPGTADETAQTSLSLLQNSGRGKKCAIYSVDINSAGTRIATCGGDGTVRLWSASALFSKKRSRFGDDGQYESSEASAEEDEENSPSDSDADEDATKTSGNNANANDNAYDDSKARDDEGVSPEKKVHDLSSLVRRKKGGEIQPSLVRPPTTKPLSSLSKPPPSSAQEKQKQQPQQQQKRLLCTLSAHTGSSVLAVRFSNNGRFLASSGDDGAVCIYTKDKKSAAATGNLAEHSAEHWSRIKLCRGHGLDVVGLAWAPDDSHLVSCSLDSETPIIVWKLTDLANNQGHVTHANVICNPFKILGKGIHTSTVKGVCFDPAGSYVASSGDDPSICIWRAHDNWELERRIDAGSGIFRRWKEDNNSQSQSSASGLSSQTMFRRLSWSTDGAFICSTNCVVKNKHVASTISREGWNVSSAQSAAAGAANLVGHKQPVVVSRHCSQLLATSSRYKKNAAVDGNNTGSSSSSSSSGEDDDEPSYATLLALGDRHGYVTVWSTKKSRPIFKLQCSNTRCTVTDLAWSKMGNHSMILLVSLLDGHCVALRFSIPEEVGPLLAEKDQARLFKFRYGIDLDDTGDMSRRALFVGGSSGPKFIENALQMSLENGIDEDNSDNDDGNASNEENTNTNANTAMNGTTDSIQVSTNSASVRLLQQETQSKGKKRIRPVLMSADDDQQGQQKRATADINGEASSKTNGNKDKNTDPLKNAADLVEKAKSATDGMIQLKRDVPSAGSGLASRVESTAPAHQPPTIGQRQVKLSTTVAANAPLQHSTSKLLSAELPLVADASIESIPKDSKKKFLVNCTNSFRIPLGSKGTSLPCVDVKVSHEGTVSWKDQLVGTACSALAASAQMLAIGTADGSVQLYGTSPTLGWSCGTAFRSHPLLVLGHPIVSLQIHERKAAPPKKVDILDLLIVTADGNFGVYELMPELRLRYKGSLMPAMVHMSLGTAGTNGGETRLPKLSRIQLTESNQLLLLLSLTQPSGRVGMDSTARGAMRANNAGPSIGSAYGSIQSFVYNLPMELWTRISDGRFVLSDFYSTLPSEKTSSRGGVLSQLDDAVRLGALDSSLTPAHHSRAAGRDSACDIYQNSEDKANYYATRSHCEDRMACALAVGSSSEFKHWLSLYVRTLSLGGHADVLRVLVDMLFGTTRDTDDQSPSSSNPEDDRHWWLSATPQVLNLDRKMLVRTVVIPEMSKNRSLQRLTNEISIEMD